MGLAERLKEARESTGKSQKEMASIAGASYRAWQGYETGENQPPTKVLEALALAGFNAAWLLTGEGPMRGDAGKISQSANGNGSVIQMTGNVSGSVNQGGGEKLPDDVQELCVLLQRYGNKTLKDDLKARLLRIKEVLEG